MHRPFDLLEMQTEKAGIIVGTRVMALQQKAASAAAPFAYSMDIFRQAEAYEPG